MHTINDQIREIIESAGSKFVSVTAVTVKGEVRRFLFNPRDKTALHKDIVSIAGAKAAETRKLNNPDLINIMDRGPEKIAKHGEPGPSSFKLDRVLSVRVNRVNYPFRHYRGPFEAFNAARE